MFLGHKLAKGGVKQLGRSELQSHKDLVNPMDSSGTGISSLLEKIVKARAWVFMTLH